MHDGVSPLRAQPLPRRPPQRRGKIPPPGPAPHLEASRSLFNVHSLYRRAGAVRVSGRGSVGRGAGARTGRSSPPTRQPRDRHSAQVHAAGAHVRRCSMSTAGVAGAYRAAVTARYPETPRPAARSLPPAVRGCSTHRQGTPKAPQRCSIPNERRTVWRFVHSPRGARAGIYTRPRSRARCSNRTAPSLWPRKVPAPAAPPNHHLCTLRIPS